MVGVSLLEVMDAALKGANVLASAERVLAPVYLRWKKTQSRMPKKEMDMVPMVAPSLRALAPISVLRMIPGNNPESSHIIIDQYMWTDLHDSSPDFYAFAHYYWKVQDDPAIRDKVFHNDWHNIDYVVTTQQMLFDAQQANLPLVEAAIEHSTVIAHFDTGGWSVDIRLVNKGG